MADLRLLTLVRRLHEATLKGQIDWQETAKAGVFQASFPEYVVKIRQQEGVEGVEDIVFEIWNVGGRLVEGATDVDLGGNDPDQGVFSLMKDLYERARSKAMGVEKAVSDLMALLDHLNVDKK